MVEKLYSEFDSDITIRYAKGKTFNENQIDFNQLKQLKGIENYTKAVEEVVVLKHEKKWVNAHLIGVDSSFLNITQMSKHMVDGSPKLQDSNGEFGLIGASLLDNLGGYIPEREGYESLLFYIPKRNAKVRLGSNPFTSQTINISGRMNFNREVNSDIVVLPIRLAKELLNYDEDITAIYIDVSKNESNDEVKERIIQFLGKDFDVKTNYEKNELIYKTSKTEKIIVLFILIFIFILAAFNLVASLTMLFIEKMENVKTMISFGANKTMIFKIFFYEGLMISFKGILFGLILGYAICFTQIYGNLLVMPNSGGEPFPMFLKYTDVVLILFLVTSLSILASFLPVKYLIKRNFNQIEF